ncbi:MAG: nucleotidyltransferase domain-containing protein [Nanoarchaeota archaeon]
MKLREVFGKNPRVLILEFFMGEADRSFSLTEIAKKTKVSIGSAFAHCEELYRKKILLREKKGKSTYYCLNRKEKTAKELKKFSNLISDPLESLIKEFAGRKIRKIILFGSYARGEDRKDSDIDLLVVGDVQPSEAILIANRLSVAYKTRFSVIVRTLEEYLALEKNEGVLWRKINLEGVTIYET